VERMARSAHPRQAGVRADSYHRALLVPAASPRKPASNVTNIGGG
jgi:hypothetical protein